MPKEVYERLTDALDSRGGAEPVIKCKELFDLLEELFAPEEADLASKMPLYLIPAETFAGEIGSEPKEVERILERMADKGLVFTHEIDGIRHYMLMVILPGIFELQFMSGEVSARTKKLAHLFEDYFKVIRQLPATEHAVSFTVPTFRVITVEKEIPANVEIHPYDKVTKYIAESDYISVSTCYCRHHGELLGNPCDKPKEVCMCFGNQAKFNAERGFGRLVSQEEALHILDISEEAGLIHCSSNTGKHIYYMCNCCECHCGVIQSIKNSAVPSVAVSSSFIVNVDEEECTGCGDCIDRCQMDALTMKGDIVVRDSERCIGCGLCVSVCPTEALKMEPREDAPVPFADRRELNAAMMPSSK